MSFGFTVSVSNRLKNQLSNAPMSLSRKGPRGGEFTKLSQATKIVSGRMASQ